MNAQMMKELLLEELGATKDGRIVTLPADRRVTIMVRFGDNVVVPKVQSVRFGEYKTSSNEVIQIVGETVQVYVASDSEFVVKAEDAKKSDDRPGFR